MTTLDLLERLVAFPTVSRDSNIALVEFVRQFLAGRGIDVELFPTEDGRKANLLATVGPRDRPGVMLSGHTDVVPVEGQNWTADPFRLTLSGGRAYGRGTADMKGFVACALSLAGRAARENLATPVHLALSHDEEVGCVGVRSMIDALARRGTRPRCVIVGEPTAMRVVTGHKGKIAARATCTGVAGHSALATRALNAVHLACDLVAAIRDLQEAIARDGARDDYDVPYTTLHVGRIEGGTALNIVPNRCTVDFEIRAIGADDGGAILQRLRGEADRIAARHRGVFPAADVRIEALNSYPGLSTPEGAEVVRFVGGLTEVAGTGKVAFGTEAGLFAEGLGAPTVVCGPGSMDQGHKPDEFIALSELDACDRMMDRLLRQCR